ncbi:zinc-binding dehydrogenase [Oscillibacter sp.]|uniref:zinc-binding dehydrogenase n=1 Tax=Oscillibacter sp. TaxID=1945593 RepID=UPI00289C3428|nr:zinc-binding dehydrogenase [Oscillibacter sp.]
MKALVKTKLGPDCMRYMDMPEPVPGADDIKVKIFACGICGTDIHLMHDEYPSKPPIITGHEFSGVVAEAGANVTNCKPGDRIVTLTAVDTCEECEWCRQGLRMLCPERKSVGSGCNGGFAEYVVIPAKHAFHLPDGIAMETAALCEPLACVCRSVCERASVKGGNFVLVAGAGVMAQLTAQVAMANGGVVIMTGLKNDAERFAMAKRLGVFETLYVDEGDPLARVMELTGGMGAQLAFECSGAAASAKFCIEALMKTGQYIQVAIPGKPILFDMDMALYKEITISNSYASERTSWLIALRLMEKKLINIAPLASSILPLTEWEEGFRRTIVKEGFKVLLMPHPEDLKESE